MIKLKLDKKFKKRFPDLDMETLSSVYSILFDSIYDRQKKRDYKIHIRMTAGVCSYYTWQVGSNVRINLSDVIFDLDLFHRSLLHEFRHFVQDKVFRIPLSKKNYDDTTEKTYMSSPVEIDANYFESVTFPKVKRLYNRLNKIKKQLNLITGYKGTTV